MVIRWRPNMPSYLRTHLLLQLPFGLLSTLPALKLLSQAALIQIRAMAEAKVAKVNYILMTLLALKSTTRVMKIKFKKFNLMFT